MTDYAFQKALEVSERHNQAQERSRKAAENLDAEHQRALQALDDARHAADIAVAAADAAAMAQFNSGKRKLEREYEAKTSQLETEMRDRLSEIADLRQQRAAYVSSLPFDEPAADVLDLHIRLYSNDEYASLMRDAQDRSFLSPVRCLLGSRLSPRQACAEIKGMVEHDAHMLDKMTSDAKANNRVESDIAKKEYQEKLARFEAEAHQEKRESVRTDFEYAEKKRDLQVRYERELCRVSAESFMMDVDNAVAECRKTSIQELRELGAAPEQLNAATCTDARPWVNMFQYWVTLELFGQRVSVPHSFNVAQPEHLMFPHDGFACAIAAIRGLVAFWLKTAGPHGVRVLWLDPVSKGRCLGALAPLAHAAQQGNSSLPITLASSDESIAQVMKDLETAMGDLSLKVAPYGDIAGYNSARVDSLLPFTVVVACGIGSGWYSDSCLKTLASASDNAAALGIQLIGTMADDGVGDSSRSSMHRLRNASVAPEWRGDTYYSIEMGGKQYPILFAGDRWISSSFVASALEAVNRKPEVMKKPLSTTVSMSEKGLVIPFGWDDQGNEACLDFSRSYAHAFVAGATGSGKSFFLHNIIAQACSRYSPEELQLCLVDYKKTEFSLFKEDEFRFPHIRLIGLDNTSEFVNALMRYLMQEFKRRQELIGKDHNISKYNRNHVETIPRLLVIMDEFHRQSSLAGYASESAKNLEFLLREARAFGMHFLLADQGIANLAGLSEPAKMQLGGRIMLPWNQSSELVDMFGGEAFDLSSLRLSPGQAVTRVGGALTVCSWPLVEEPELKGMAQRAQAQWPALSVPLVHDSSEVVELDARSWPKSSSALLLGFTADFLAPELGVTLLEKRRENVFVLNKDEGLTMRLLFGMVASFRRYKPGGQIVLLTEESDPLLSSGSNFLSLLTSDYALDVRCGAENICDWLSGFDGEDAFVVISSPEVLFEQFEELGDASGMFGRKDTAVASIDDEIDRLLSIGSKTSGEAERGEEVVPVTLFDARPRFFELMRGGGSKGVHACVISDSRIDLFTLFGSASHMEEFATLFPYKVLQSCSYSEAISLGAIQASEMSAEDSKRKMLFVGKTGEVALFEPYEIKL